MADDDAAQADAPIDFPEDAMPGLNYGNLADRFNYTGGHRFDPYNYGAGNYPEHGYVPNNDYDFHSGEHWWERWGIDIQKLSDRVFYFSLAMLVVFFFQWFINRFTDGIWPSERKLARELRQKSKDYIESKKFERQSLLSKA